ncbi:MAG: hypothetical protein IPK28_03650 [Devosia sp.]|nr:hypothetical protein [Devosia sp.]
MRRFFRLVFWIVLAAMPVPAALASFDSSRAWFETMADHERAGTQADLILLGHYQFLVDGQFGRATFDALGAFQTSQGGTGTGVLSASEQAALRRLAGRVGDRLGLEAVSDRPGHVEMSIPVRLLPLRTLGGTGTTYASADGEFSLETMHASLAGQSFSGLFHATVRRDDDRTVTYRTYGERRFVVSGTMGDQSYYTMFVNAGAEAVGYTLAWGSAYQVEGRLTSVWLASHFTPHGTLPPDEELGKTTGAPPPSLRGAFDLPPDQPEIIALNTEIDGVTPRDLDRAMAARPEARILVLNSPGGAVDSALVLAQEVRRRGLKTYVPPSMGCYSACAYIFFAGSDRQADGELGVHQISTDVADLVLAQATLGDVLDALHEFGVRQQVISHMLRTPPEDMYVFSALELRELGINRGEPITLAVNGEDDGLEGSASPSGAFVELASQTDRAEAERSLAYASGRWSGLFGQARLAIERTPDGVFRVRLGLVSLPRANTICAAIKAEGGGCFVRPGGESPPRAPKLASVSETQADVSRTCSGNRVRACASCASCRAAHSSRRRHRGTCASSCRGSSSCRQSRPGSSSSMTGRSCWGCRRTAC